MYADPDFAESRIGWVAMNANRVYTPAPLNSNSITSLPLRTSNDRFNLSDGVVGLAFDPESRTVYFQPLATDR